MIDLDDLEKKLDEALSKETLESLRSWLEGKRKNPLVIPHELHTVELAHKTLVWMIHSRRFDDYRVSEVREKLNDVFGEEIMNKVKKTNLMCHNVSAHE